MINTQVVNPYLTTAAAGTPSNAAAAPALEQPAAPVPADVVSMGSSAAAEQSATLGLGKKAGVAVMAGLTLLGVGVAAPSTAEAHGMSQGQVIPARYYGHGGWGGHHGGGAGGAIIGGIIGGMIGGAIVNGGGYYPAPPPVYYPAPPPVYYPAPPPVYNPGYNTYGCDGVFHHFDAYGNVNDASGNYRLQQNQWGTCYRTAPMY